MERGKAYLASGIAALVLAVAGAGITLGVLLIPSFMEGTGSGIEKTDGAEKIVGDDVNGSADAQNESDRTTFGEQPIAGSRDPPPGPSGEEGASDGTPWFIYAGAFAALLFALMFVGISGRAYAESSRHENVVRNDLVDLISYNPGINLTSIRSELQLSQGAVSYHLRRLEKGGVIYSHKGMKERRYYPATMGYNQVEDRSAQDEVRSIIANPTGSRIIELLGQGDATQTQIVNEVGVSPSTVHWHMERMERAGLIRKRREGRSVVYCLGKRSADT